MEPIIYSKHMEDTGCVLVMASGIGCISVCEDDEHADYVIQSIKNGKFKIGEKGLELSNGTNT